MFKTKPNLSSLEERIHDNDTNLGTPNASDPSSYFSISQPALTSLDFINQTHVTLEEISYQISKMSSVVQELVKDNKAVKDNQTRNDCFNVGSPKFTGTR